MSLNYESKLNEIGNAICQADRGTSAFFTLRSKLMSFAFNYVRYGNYFSKLSRKFRFSFPDQVDAVSSKENGNGLEYFTTEIMDTCDDVINGYSPDKGEFIAYFNSAMYNSLNSAIGELIYTELHGGIRTSLKKAKLIARLMKDLNEDGIETDDKNILLRSVEYECGLTEEDVRAYRSTVVDPGNMKDEQGNRYEDITPLIKRSTAVIDEGYLDPQVVTAAKDRSLDVIWYIEYYIGELPDARKEYLSDCMTSKMSRWLGLYEFRHEEAELTNWFKPEIFQFFVENGEPMPMTQIAVQHGMNLSSLSRAFTKLWSHIADAALYEAMYESVIKIKTQ